MAETVETGAAQPAAQDQAAQQKKYQDCMKRAGKTPKAALKQAMEWEKAGGGDAARHCVAASYMGLKQFDDAAMELERIALEDEYFVEKKLYPNVDFYSGIVQRAMGIPVSMFTAIFALARTVGWVAQWNEMISDPEQKIGRPRQLFIGERPRDVAPIGMRD